MFTWIKQNKLATFLVIVVAYFIYKNFFGYTPFTANFASKEMAYDQSISSMGAPSSGISRTTYSDIYPPPPEEYAPQLDADNRLVIRDSQLSLLVKDVVDTRNKILEYAKNAGGYMVNSATQSPEEAPSATIIVRVPAEELQGALDYFHSLSVKVVSENLVGRDVTDQYVDIETRISQIERTKARLEEILEQATEIEDITNLTTQILSYQNQIDSLKGQQDALEKNAESVKITIYLSTDEIALPYAPSDTFRPTVIFKLAVRSLVGALRDLAAAAIWVLVYSVIWLPAVGVYFLLRKWLQKKAKS